MEYFSNISLHQQQLPKEVKSILTSKYKMITQRSYQFQNSCSELAVNVQNTLLIIVHNNKMKVMQLKEGQLKQFQIIQNNNRILGVKFFKTKQHLISGSSDGSLTIWHLGMLANPKYLIKLKEHSMSITSIVLHPPHEDVITSSSLDGKINFICNNSFSFWSLFQTISEHNYLALDISINLEGKTLISYGQNQQILIMKKSSPFYWEVQQIIQEKNRGYSINFITNCIFIFQTWIKSYIYSLNFQTGEYNKQYKIHSPCNNLSNSFIFPSFKFPSSKIICQNGFKIYIISFLYTSRQEKFQERDRQETNLQQFQYIRYPKYGDISVTLSEDQKFLITWDLKSKEIMIMEKE